MASFDKVTTSCTPTLAPKPIAAVAPPPPLSSAAFTERDDDDDDDDDDEEEGGLDLDLAVDVDEEEEESGGEEEDDDGVDDAIAIDLKKIRGDDWSSRQPHFSSSSGYENALVIAAREPCYAHTFNPVDVFSSSSAHNNPLRSDNMEYKFRGQEEGSYWDVLRSHFSDPVTGALMDDAMILSCGHSYGRGGMQQVYLMKACCKCSQPISEDLVRPNFALRTAVEAFRREEEMHLWRASKRTRDQLEQEKCGYEDTFTNDFLRNRASLFPLAISDRVIIKGNKRTPPRFVGRVALVTEQCLNGWYVVKTLDNGESIKLQFGSLAKVSADQPTNMVPTRANYPNWL